MVPFQGWMLFRPIYEILTKFKMYDKKIKGIIDNIEFIMKNETQNTNTGLSKKLVVSFAVTCPPIQFCRPKRSEFSLWTYWGLFWNCWLRIHPFWHLWKTVQERLEHILEMSKFSVIVIFKTTLPNINCSLRIISIYALKTTMKYAKTFHRSFNYL